MSAWLSSRDWALHKLSDHIEVISVAPVGELFIGIERKEYDQFVTAILSEKLVLVPSIETAFSLNVEPFFVANLPRESVWTGAAISAAQERWVGWGGFGDLLRAIGQEDVRSYQNKEYMYIERCINQHDKVSSFDRVFDRLYDIHRTSLPSILVAFVYEYELTAEHVRGVRDKFGKCSAIANTNPYGNITGEAHKVGKQLGSEVLKMRELLGRPNRA